MTTGVSLRDVLLEEAAHCDDKEPEKRAARVLESGLQEILTLLVAVMFPALARERSVPPGLTTRFKECASRPTVGSLRDFLVWVSSNDSLTSLPTLSAYLQQEKKDGWLSRLVELRNRWQHPKGETREAVVAQVVTLLQAMPEELQLARIEVTAHGDAVWTNRGESVSLRPFGFAAAGELHVFTHFEPPGILCFKASDAGIEQEFRNMWSELRVLDQKLEDPTSEEFSAKARRAAAAHHGDAPWWLDRMADRGPNALLVDPTVIDGALAHLTTRDPTTVVVDLPLANDQSVPSCLAEKLGLARPPDAKELLAFVGGKSTCALAVRCQPLSVRGFSQVLYWLADLRDAGPSDTLRILVGRDPQQLEADQEKLWDRLPERMEDLLRKPPSSKGAGLVAFLWPKEKPKWFLGLF